MQPFYSKERLLQKCEKLYHKGDIFLSFIENTSYFPLVLPLEKPKEVEIKRDFISIVKSIKLLESTRLDLVYDNIHFKSIGTQRLPVKVLFQERDTFLDFIQKSEEYKVFTQLYQSIVMQYSTLSGYFTQKPFVVLTYKEVWKEILDVVQFLLDNPHPNIYIRELSIPNIDTKFIETYKKMIDVVLSVIQNRSPLKSLSHFAFEEKYSFKYPKPLVRFRLLDAKLAIEGLTDISIPIDALKALHIGCKKVFIVENKVTVLSFPRVDDAIIIFGQGYGLVALKEIVWLQELPIYYWGDIDSDGFAILSQLRSFLPQTTSLLMDSQTLEKFEVLKVHYRSSKAKQRVLTHLTPEENALYHKLLHGEYGENFRLEQEKIPFDYLLEKLREIV